MQRTSYFVTRDKNTSSSEAIKTLNKCPCSNFFPAMQLNGTKMSVEL